MSVAAMALISGALACGYFVAGLFFLRFWTRTGERLFLAFAVAFAMMALNQIAPIVLGVARDDQAGLYLLRLAAFVIIILAVVSKNLGPGQKR